jgi:hypothetical protein
MALPLSLDPLMTPLILLALEAVFVFFSADHLLTLRSMRLEVLKHLGFIVRMLWYLLLTLVSLIAGFLFVSPIFAAGQAGFALVLGALMFRFWPRLSRTLSEGPLSEAIWGGAITLIGLVVLIWAFRPFDWEGALAGVVVGGAGIAMMVGGIRKLSAGE